MWGKNFIHKGYQIYLSSGGASIIFEYGSYTSPNIKPPKIKPSKKVMIQMANQIVKEHEDFLKQVPQ